MNNLNGLVFYSILSHHSHGGLQCQVYYDGMQDKCLKFPMKITKFNSNHVFIWYDPRVFINFHKTMDDQNIDCRTKMSFEFLVFQTRSFLSQYKKGNHLRKQNMMM